MPIQRLENEKTRLEAEASGFKEKIVKLHKERAEASLKTMEAKGRRSKGKIGKLSKEVEGLA